MEFGQSLTFFHTCVVAIGFTVFAPVAGYQRQAYEPDSEIRFSSENNDPKTSSAESDKSPASTDGKSKKDEGRLKEVATAPSAPPGSSQWYLLPFADAKKLSLIEKAYLDAFTILKEENSCSRLYGGSSAIGALNELVRRLTPTHLDRLIGVRMQGETSSARDHLTGRAFRLFQHTEINLSGPFFRGNTSPFESKVPFIGSFPPNTREARVTILLHELGHLLSTADKQWVLPDDGNDVGLSRKNTERVIDVCRDQITQISHLSFRRELTGAGHTASE
jgi:hypothetical protein